MTGRRIITILSVFGFVLVMAVGYGVFEIYRSGFWRGPDVQFGDQHLKTTVALIELHKTRFGSYPKSLSELKYVGEWDKIPVNSVRYVPNKELNKYCVVVTRGWIGKPELNMPEEFWRGTGYDPSLCAMQ